MRFSLALMALCIGSISLAGCKGVGAVCDQSGSTDECGSDLICTFKRTPATFDPNADPPPPLSVCLRKCERSTDCGEGEVCRLVFCSTQRSCQTGPLEDPPPNVCGGEGAGGTGGGGGVGGMGGMAGMGGGAGMGGTGGGSQACDSIASAFIKTLDPGNNFNLTNLVDEDTTNLPETWDRYSIELAIDAGLEGQLLQVGFNATASNFEPSGVFYDNVVVEPGPEYSQDFESLEPSSPTALSDDGWVVFGNVFEADGTTFAYGYGPDPAPNNTGAFSGIALGQGGVDQGAQALVIISDYNNSDQNTGRRIEANTFRERTITAADVGNTIVFSFDAKRGNINQGCPAP